VITIAPNALTGIANGVAYSVTLTGAGGTAPYTFAVVSGSLPTGLSLNGSTGVISGTPTAPGTFSFTIRATDSTAATGDQAYAAYVSGLIYWFICTNAPYPAAVPVAAGTQAAFNRLTVNYLAGLSKSKHQPGDLLARPTSDPVNSHLLCDGSAVGRADFPQLFDAIGTQWGAGDGSTTFNIPNLIGSLPLASTTPSQTITPSTVSTGGTVTQPSGDGQTGGSSGGNFSSGGRPRNFVF